MQSYTPPIPEFSIDCIAEVSAATSLSTEGGVELLFCLEGQGELESSEGGSAGSRLPITDHAIFLVPGALREYRINPF
jgi:hypothetical protein